MTICRIRNEYQPFTQFVSCFYGSLHSLAALNQLYHYGFDFYLGLFRATLDT